MKLTVDKICICSFVMAVVLAIAGDVCYGGDWPSHRHDNFRSGATPESLEVPLKPTWVRNTARGPRPEWSETPALQDFWQGTYGHKSRLPAENAFRIVVADERLYFGSSSSDKLTCLDIRTGLEEWKFFAGGPIRFAPSVYEGKVYFGSDDGNAYCLDGSNGSVVWQKNYSGTDELMFIDGRMVSVCPVRTSVLVDSGVAYWGGGLFSGSQTGLDRYVCAANAEDGSLVWKKTPPKPLQGYPLVSTNNLYMPSGKSTPIYFRRLDGSYLGSFGSSRQGGAYAVLSEDNKFYFGPHYSGSGSYIGKYDANTQAAESVAWGPGNHLVVTASYSYYSSDTAITKINRSTKQVMWQKASRHPYDLIVAGDKLFAGGDDEVAAMSNSTGDIVWLGEVTGRVRSLAVANKCLFVSTDKGTIHCFSDGLSPDVNSDGKVNFTDFSKLSLFWMFPGCGICEGTDLSGDDGIVGIDDLLFFSDYWTAGQ